MFKMVLEMMDMGMYCQFIPNFLITTNHAWSMSSFSLISLQRIHHTR